MRGSIQMQITAICLDIGKSVFQVHGIRIDPEFAEAYYNRGKVKGVMGDIAGADADIAKARQLRPGIGQ
jgi:hypothetical protein